MIPRDSPPPAGRTAGAAAMLADRLERFCARGIGYRSLGVCREPGVSVAAHERLGHDAGCATLGVPRRAIVITLGMWDRVGATPLLLEAIDEAITSLAEAGAARRTGEWNAQLASECVAFAIRSKITPSPSEQAAPTPPLENTAAAMSRRKSRPQVRR
ncbi:hypothetical protein JOF28_000420 [Leucobacter exalbidus]|uniref:Uncharacterized protein n=1 Tax=Leucobacter exalbidus TaxID=662960 RepID=A0A940T2V4_9MICO|nr:hypothetical protein [Leucobacter exalbidus]MBP1325188.1 hypothetical protein [Leucobacter exalbidus]